MINLYFAAMGEAIGRANGRGCALQGARLCQGHWPRGKVEAAQQLQVAPRAVIAACVEGTSLAVR